MISIASRIAAIGLAAGVVGLLAPSVAGASNCYPFVPAAVFEKPPCLTVVDRSVDPIVRLEYQIYEGEAGPAVVDGTQTRDVFAFSVWVDESTLPDWLSAKAYTDAIAALEKAAILCEDPMQDPPTLDDPGPLLEGHVFRLTKASFPIAPGPSAETFDWDTSSVDPGTYVVAIYTLNPMLNTWAVRYGAIKVVDDASDPGAAPPTVFLGAEDPMELRAESCHALSACTHAAPGSVVTLSWKKLFDPEDPWKPVFRVHPEGNGDLPLGFTVPVEATGEILGVQVEIEDPEGRRYVARGRYGYMVHKSEKACREASFIADPDCEPDPAIAPDDPLCATQKVEAVEPETGGGTEGASETGASEGTGGTSGGSKQEGTGGSCGCQSPGSLPWGFGVGSVAMLGLRRRSSRGGRSFSRRLA